MQNQPVELTKKLAEFIVDTNIDNIPDQVFEHAKIAFMDWLGVTMAGKDDPLVTKLINYCDILGGNQQATVLGHKMKKTITQATLINGSASHALDYDDTLESFLGHPSVTIFPSLLALSEWQAISGQDFLTAYIIGLKIGATIGACGGMDHYMSGWHATSTLGHFASAAGCAKLLGLSKEQTVFALGIAGTQASGLKRVFGTMCKPFHAGRSSQAGLTSALLAKEGFTSATDILEGPYGFFQVLKGKINEPAIGLLGKTWDIENLAQKYHASCHATHSPIEGALSIIKKENLDCSNITSIEIFSSKLALDAAGKTTPASGLEGKFSIPYCVANALLRGNTGMQAFTDEKVNQADIKAFMEKIQLNLDESFTGLESRVEIKMKTGKTYTITANILKDIPVLEEKKIKIRDKFIDLCEPIFSQKLCLEILAKIDSLENIKNMQFFIELLG